MKRGPAVAGVFYPGKPAELRETLNFLIESASERVRAIAVVSPHAGYMYSGKVAGRVFGRIEAPDTAIILGPNHTGLGAAISLYPGEAFVTPLGEARIDEELREALFKECSLFTPDVKAHEHEHSLEVQVPFLQYLNPIVKIVPVCLSYISLKEIKELGETIAKVIKAFPEKKILIVASSDFSHYVPHEVAKEKDKRAIEKILNLDEEGLIKRVVEERISMCGVVPVSVAMVASKGIKEKPQAELVAYQTSGDVIGDYSSVVGYGGIIVK